MRINFGKFLGSSEKIMYTTNICGRGPHARNAEAWASFSCTTSPAVGHTRGRRLSSPRKPHRGLRHHLASRSTPTCCRPSSRSSPRTTTSQPGLNLPSRLTVGEWHRRERSRRTHSGTAATKTAKEAKSTSEAQGNVEKKGSRRPSKMYAPSRSAHASLTQAILRHHGRVTRHAPSNAKGQVTGCVTWPFH